MYLLSLVNHILKHPLNKNNKANAFKRFLKWQLNTFINPYATIYPLTIKSKLIVSKGMTGATQNIYCGLADYEDMFFLLHFLRQNDYFIDVGANIGSYTILAGAHVGSKVISFEPVPATYTKLVANIKINNIEETVLPLNMALGGSCGIINFTDAFDTVNHVATSDEKIAIKVKVDMLDSIINDKVPSLIKIDVEGYETEVLRGGDQTLQNETLKAIIIELNGSGERYGYKEEDIHAKLLSYGFQPYSYQPKDRMLQKLSNYGQSNTIYLRDYDFVINRLKSAERITVLNQAI